MAMTLRLDEQETGALRAHAEVEHRSVQDVAERAVRGYIERHRHRTLVEPETASAVTRHAEALRELDERWSSTSMRRT
jgi:predicted transcriptional regulator